mmetsp:Transcript_86866/g.265919  ORF Transcript_86866/g.265919 Transcript_86866/m.265919 type:complete len:216 (-) Transcript_86866:252-899(-)
MCVGPTLSSSADSYITGGKGLRAPSGWSFGWSRPSRVYILNKNKLLSAVCAPSTTVALFTSPRRSSISGAMGNVTPSTVAPTLDAEVKLVSRTAGTVSMHVLFARPAAVRQPAARAASRVPASAASKGLADSDPDWPMAPRNRPAEPGATYCSSTSPAPELCPWMATRAGSPPRAAASRCTQRSALWMSRTPQLPVDRPLAASSAKAIHPSGPVR